MGVCGCWVHCVLASLVCVCTGPCPSPHQTGPTRRPGSALGPHCSWFWGHTTALTEHPGKENLKGGMSPGPVGQGSMGSAAPILLRGAPWLAPHLCACVSGDTPQGPGLAGLLTDNGHQGVEVANVEALTGHVDEELHHLGPLLLLGWLGTRHLSLSGDMSPPHH